MVHTPNNLGHQMVRMMDQAQQTAEAVQTTQALLQQIHMVNDFTQIVEQHSVSAPVIEIMRAVPVFEQATTNFPDASLYNQIPAHRSDSKYTMAMESLGEVKQNQSVILIAATKDIADQVSAILANASDLGTTIKVQLQQDRQKIEQSDISDIELSMLQTIGLTDAAMSDLFVGLESYYDTAAPFDADALRAFPDQLSQQVESIASLMQEVGPILGLTMTATGITDTVKAVDYQPTQGFFEEKNLDKAVLLFQLDRAESLCDMLIALGERQDEFASRFALEAQDIPELLHGDDTNYGADDHITLMGCHVTLLRKVVQETVRLTSSLLATTNVVTDLIAVGEDAMAAPVDVEEPEVPEVLPEVDTAVVEA